MNCMLPDLDPCQTVVVQLAMVCVPMGACMGSIGKPLLGRCGNFDFEKTLVNMETLRDWV